MSIAAAPKTAAVTVLAGALVLTGCGADGPGDGAADGRPTVLAGFYPLEWAASRVAGDLASVSSLTPPGAEAHDLELTPQDVAALSEADLVVYVEGFQPAVDEAVAAEAGDAAWDAGEAADLTLTTEGHDHGDAEDEAHRGDEAHAGEEVHADEATHADEELHADDELHADEEVRADEARPEGEGQPSGEGHAEEGTPAEDEIVDPHFWLDPTRLADVGDALAERMTELDPEGAATYQRNAADLRADLEALDREMQETLADCAVDTLVTSHDAFGYLGDRYGFEVVGISGLEPSQEPSPAELAEIADLVAERGVRTVYTEVLIDPAVAETVAAEAGVGTAVLDPLEGLTGESPGADYLEVMRANAETLRQGQGCG